MIINNREESKIAQSVDSNFQQRVYACAENFDIVDSAIFNWHGLFVKFNVSRASDIIKVKTELNLELVSISEENERKLDFTIFWDSSSEIIQNHEFDYICHLSEFQGKEFAHQRDFIGIKLDNTSGYFQTGIEWTDGLYNAIRWLLCRELIKLNKLVIHSSALISPDGEGLLFLGHSGAGKTTIVEKHFWMQSMGDDMNLLTVENNRIMLERANLGKGILKSERLKAVPLKTIFWLEKGDGLSIKRIDPARSCLKLYASLTNLFWKDKVSRINLDLIDRLIKTILKNCPVYRLKTSLKTELFDYVER